MKAVSYTIEQNVLMNPCDPASAYTIESQDVTEYYCAHHFNLVMGDVGITVSDAPADAVCFECEMADAAYESDKRAELRNEMFMLGIS